MGENEIAMQMWDFGGQDIYHGTHALFMRDNAIFALIWAKDFERRSEDESDGLISAIGRLAIGSITSGISAGATEP